MDTKTHPFERGKRNAEAIIDTSGLASARKWLADRIADESKPKLPISYVNGFEAGCSEATKAGL